MNKFNNTIKNVADDNAIPFVDFDTDMPKSLEYFVDDVHFTKKGAEKMADILYQFIVLNEIIYFN